MRNTGINRLVESTLSVPIVPMTSYVDSQQVYSGPQFERWARAENLIEPERFLIERYLHPDGRTLEAGAGGGRILRALAGMGFRSLAGFDSVATLIEQARLKDSAGQLAFSVQDARCTSYSDGEFDQIIYLQQVLCFISDQAGRRKAVTEAFRVLKPRGSALFSFLCLEVRRQSFWYRRFLNYLACLRAATGQDRPLQELPWLKLKGRANCSALLDRPPYVYWFRCEEAVRLLTSAGFEIIGLGTKAQTDAGRLCRSIEELHHMPLDGMLYVVCRK
jgi:ubiquinone/menaquinone biosynthesis C-methylase UbiE